MKKLVFAICFTFACAGLPAADTPASPAGGKKKIIEYGWDVRNPAYIRKNIREMEKLPFDGIIFQLEAGARFMRLERLDKDKLARDFENCRAIEWNKFTDNFVSMWSDSSQDWFNDEHWELILGNARLIGEDLQDGRGIAKEFLHDLETAAEHCAELTRGLLAFARRTPSATAPLAVAPVLDESRPVAAHGGVLLAGVPLRHHDGRRDADAPRGEGDALTVVPPRGTDHAAPRLELWLLVPGVVRNLTPPP